MDDEGAARAALFGGAKPRAAGERNRYADAHPSSLPAASEAPPSPESAGSSLPRPERREDLERGELLAGGRKMERAGASGAAEEGPEDGVGVGEMEEADMDFDFTDLDLTTQEIDFSELEGDLAQFRQHPVVKEAIERGVDLQQYARQVDDELRSTEVASVEDYVKEADRFATLYREISDCEDILQSMQSLLSGFQGNLSGISAEIRNLQEESLTRNVKLRNRRAVGRRVQVFLDRVAVSEEMIDTICEGQIDDQFVDDLRALSAKIAFTTSGNGGREDGGSTRQSRPRSIWDEPTATEGSGEASQTPQEPFSLQDLGIDPFATLAGRDALPQLERLRVAAVTRCREWLLHQIEELKRPRTNIQKIQQYVFLRYRDLFFFLREHAPEIAAEIRVTYIDSMGRILQSFFRNYHNALMKVHVAVASRHDLVVPEETRGARSIFAAREADPADRARTTAFDLESRSGILRHANAEPLNPHLLQAEKERVSYEAVFRSIQRRLIDAAEAEFAFCRAFFGDRGPMAEGRSVFQQVMARAVSQVLENLENHLFHCHDAIAILLMVHITHSHRSTVFRRPSPSQEEEGDGGAGGAPGVEEGAVEAPPVLESYFDRVTLLLWPRFKAVFDAQRQSVRDAAPEKLGPVSPRPHYVTRRFAAFTASVLSLHRSLQRAGGISDEMVVQNVGFFRADMERLWGALAQSFPHRKIRVAFLLHQYNLCLRSWREASVPEEDCAHLREMAATQVDIFVEEELGEHFGRLVALVRAARGEGPEGGPPGAPESGGPVRTVPESEASALVRDFAATWTVGLQRIHDSVMRLFGGERMAPAEAEGGGEEAGAPAAAAGAGAGESGGASGGRGGDLGLDVLKQALTRLLVYYTRFQEIVKQSCPSNSAILGHLVSVPTIFNEIKKYSRGAGEGR